MVSRLILIANVNGLLTFKIENLTFFRLKFLKNYRSREDGLADVVTAQLVSKGLHIDDENEELSRYVFYFILKSSMISNLSLLLQP